MGSESTNRIFIKIKKETLPKIRDRYPFLFLEHGRVEVDDSSIKWIDSEGFITAIPVANLSSLILGPGTSVTHAAIKIASSANCNICWVGEDSLLFYAAGSSPTSDSKNYRTQIALSADKKKSLEVARYLFSKRFPKADLEGKSLKEMMGMEGHRVRSFYQECAQKYDVIWDGREFTPGQFTNATTTNRIITASNAALYSIVSSVLHSLGLSLRAGFIHSGSPLPFVYDMADLYKEEYSIDLAFSLTKKLTGFYDKSFVANAFRERAINNNLLERISEDAMEIIKKKW